MEPRQKKKRLAYYITDHGLGHAVRSLEVIYSLLMQTHELEVIVVSTLPEFIVRSNLQFSLAMRRKRLDIGLVQKDSIRFDLPATLEALRSLYDHKEVLLAEEIEFLQTENIQAIVCDIPFLPFAAASRCGIPAIGIGNFTWDWIYEGYASSNARWMPLVSWIRECYQGCNLFLQLPMHGDCSACPTIRSVPLVARPAERKPEETRQILGLPSEKKTYLVSFSALELNQEAQERVQDISNAVFLHKSPLNFRFNNRICLDNFDISYSDAVAAADGVITKPGYGIVADCLVHGVPVIYTDRGSFPEYSILVKEMEKHLGSVYLSSENLYAGRWESAVRQLESQPLRNPAIVNNGAQICAEEILNLLLPMGAPPHIPSQ